MTGEETSGAGEQPQWPAPEEAPQGSDGWPDDEADLAAPLTADAWPDDGVPGIDAQLEPDPWPDDAVAGDGVLFPPAELHAPSPQPSPAGRRGRSDVRRHAVERVDTRSSPLPGDPPAFDFYQAVRLLEARFPGRPRLGERGPARLEPIRLTASTSLAFPTSDIEQAGWRPDPLGGPDRAELRTHFLGLTGTASPLPVSYAEQVMLLEEDRPNMRDFLDLFHHRFLSLLYRGWMHHRHELAYLEDGRDPLSRALLDMLGIDPDTPADALGTTPTRLLRYAGLLLMPSRPASGLRTILSLELEAPIRLEQLTARWVELEPERRYRMNARAKAGGKLGRDVVVGARIRDRSGTIKVVVGPLPYARLAALRPEGEDGRRLVALTRLYVRQPLDVEIEVLVPACEVPPARLSGRSPERLGRMGIVGGPRQDPVAFTFEVKACHSTVTVPVIPG